MVLVVEITGFIYPVNLTRYYYCSLLGRSKKLQLQKKSDDKNKK